MWRKKKDQLENRKEKFLGKETDEQSGNNDAATTPSVGVLSIFRYANKVERYLMIGGTIFGLGQSVTQALWLQTYFFVVNTFTSFGANISNGSIPNNTVIDEFVDTVITEGAVKFVILGFVNVLLVAISSFSWSVAAERQIVRIRSDTFRSMLSQEMGWFDLKSPGELNNYLAEDIQNIRGGIGNRVADFFILMSHAIGGIVMAFISGWKMTIVFLCFMPLVAGSLIVLIMMIKKYTAKEMEAYAKAGAVAEETLSGIRTVTAFSGQKRESLRYRMTLMAAKVLGIRKGLVIGICQCAMMLFLYSSFAVLVWYGPLLIRQDPDSYSPGTVMVVFFGVLGGTFSIGAVAPNLQSFAEARGSAAKVYDIIERESKIDVTSNGGKKPEKLVGNIQFSNVSFAYPARLDQMIFETFNIQIEAGRSTALVGPSGCGKSTILQLVQRFYDPDLGSVLVDGVDIKDLNLAWLRSQIGVVSQEPVLFFGTVAENIQLGRPTAGINEIVKAAKVANAHEFIMKLPKGYDSMIGERGASLSGGQKQRIAIARAIISDPKILLLDEATSALDTESEHLVQQALDEVGKNRTTITVAHRLSTISNADKIYVLERGRVVEQGNHSQLMQNKGLYFELVTAQSSDTDPEERSRSKSISVSIAVEKEEKEDEELIEEKDEDGSEEESEIYIPRVSFSVERIEVKKKKRRFRWSVVKKKVKRYLLKQIRNLKVMLDVFRFNINEIHYIVVGILFISIMASIMPFFAVAFTTLFEVFIKPPEEQVSATQQLALIMFGLGILGGVSNLISSYSLGKSGEELTCRMRVKSFTSMISQDIAWFDEDDNRVGALLTRLSLDASQMKGMTGQRLAIVAQSVAAIVIGGTLCFISSTRLTLVMLCMMPLILLGGYMQGQNMSNRMKSSTTKNEKVGQSTLEEDAGKVASEALNNVKTIVSMKREYLFCEKYESYFNQIYKKQIWNSVKSAIGTGISQSILYFLYAVAFAYGVHLLVKNQIEFYTIFRVVALLNMVGSSLGRGAAFLIDFEQAREAAESIVKVIRHQPTIDSASTIGTIIEDPACEIELKDVEFTYPSRPNVIVLDGVSFKSPSKKTTAMVGPSGCGKSTTVSLLLRFYNADNGKVTLDGIDIESLNIGWLRSQIGFVQQEPVLFDMTIKENILYGSPENVKHGMDDVIKAAKMANVHSDIMLFPEGYDTKVGSKGSHLSGGQKQRICIARALIRNPRILLLDEATSALDTTSERIVQAALDSAKLQRTTLTIAHRLSTIRDSEQILVFDRGTILERGTHEELVKLAGLYAELTTAQSMKD